MAWAVPQFSREQVDAAGAILAADKQSVGDSNQALLVISNWRSSHSFPLNTFQVTLRAKARQIDSRSLVAQRIKRLSSIHDKLRRFGEWLRLSEMQDIGGCRAIVSSVKHVDELAALYKSSSIRHKLVDEDDYIRNPKRSGYRGVHLIYEYLSDKMTTYNGLKIEMQFVRSVLRPTTASTETERLQRCSTGAAFLQMRFMAFAPHLRGPIACCWPPNRYTSAWLRANAKSESGTASAVPGS